MMKIIDRYLIKQFLQTILFALVGFTLIFVIIDAMENLDDFIDQDVPAIIVLQYYLVFIPEIIKLMTPVSVLFGALYTAGKLTSLSELTAIRASGVSLFRFMLPFAVTSLFISIGAVYFGGYVVPMANKEKIYIGQVYLKKGLEYTGNNIYFQDSSTRVVNISFFDSNSNRANRVSIQDFDINNLTRMTSRIDAQKLEYDSLTNSWIAYSGVSRRFSEEGETADYFKSLNLTNLQFEPGDLVKKQRKQEEINLSELSDLIETQKRAGNDPTIVQIEFHSRIAFAVTSLLIVLFGLPIAVKKKKSGIATQIGINLLITFAYLVLLQVSKAFGKNGALDPILTAWFANFIIMIGTAITLPRMRF